MNKSNKTPRSSGLCGSSKVIAALFVGAIAVGQTAHAFDPNTRPIGFTTSASLFTPSFNECRTGNSLLCTVTNVSNAIINVEVNFRHTNGNVAATRLLRLRAGFVGYAQAVCNAELLNPYAELEVFGDPDNIRAQCRWVENTKVSPKNFGQMVQPY